ncbi:GIY-YIG nuclease family protein [Christensenella sp. MSJ-20]|uniref:GIY-YIG nuclease family protein n=1 Tax=Christensenella sp. MSJ-20 TaxID=2841518 RepID=UPI001C754370|nr:GIY-YIG nuclease family protein [Christensenella sp. MSJ-20]
MDQERRRTLRRQYREAPREGGIICIQNRETGQRFLLAEPNLSGARNKFLFAIQTNSCCYAALQKDWAAYGPAGYSFEVLETLRPQEGQTPKEFREDLNQLLALWRQRENEA